MRTMNNEYMETMYLLFFTIKLKVIQSMSSFMEFF